MSMDQELTQDPTSGASDGTGEQQQQSTPAQQAPAGRTYTEADYNRQFAEARRSWEADSRRREQQLRSELEQRFVAREQPKTNDPWSKFDPAVAAAMREVMEHEFSQRLTPFQQQQEDIAFRNDEAEIRSKYPDYATNRVDILEFAVQNGIANLDTAYRAWKYDELSKLDPKKIGQDAIAQYTKRKSAQASTTPAVEGRGGGAPSSTKKVKSWDDADEAALDMYRSSQDSSV